MNKYQCYFKKEQCFAFSLQPELERLWYTRLPKSLNKDNLFLDICKMKVCSRIDLEICK
jgi:hypothetical protein